MSPRRQAVTESLARCTARLDVVLVPWGFTFVSDGIESSHTGPCAFGDYRRNRTLIGLAVRESIDALFYEHSFVTDYPCHSEIETFTIDHGMLMESLGHAGDCWFGYSNEIAKAKCRPGSEDVVEALIHDLEMFAAPVLRQPCEEFDAIMRRGQRSVAFGMPNSPNRGQE